MQAVAQVQTSQVSDPVKSKVDVLEGIVGGIRIEHSGHMLATAESLASGRLYAAIHLLLNGCDHVLFCLGLSS